MPESLAIRCGGMDDKKQAFLIEPDMLSWPQPAHSVEIDPS
ncbi:MAG: hypothetical protein ACR2O0_06820 [Rhizobiaceae bacterium]